MVPGRVSVWRDPPTTDTHTVSVSNGQPTTPALVKVTLEESQFSVSLKSQLLLVISATFVNSEESTHLQVRLVGAGGIVRSVTIRLSAAGVMILQGRERAPAIPDPSLPLAQPR